MDIGLLRAFLAVAEHRNYGRAARELLVTQPTLTKQIQSLEARVGGRLFRRGRHGATLTELGSSLVLEAQDLVRRSDALDRRMGRMARGEVGRLSIGFGLSSIERAPRLVAAFRRRYPEARLVLDDMSSREQLDRLATGELDVGFMRPPPGGAWGSLALGTDRLALATTSGADLSDPGDLVQLRRDRGPGLVGQIDRLCEALDIRPRVVQESQDLLTVLALVAAGVGAAFVPAGAARVAPHPVVVTPIDHPAAQWQVAVVWDPGRAHPMTARFLDLVRESH